MSNDLKAIGISSLIWDIMGKLVNSGMGFILTIFLARLLEPSEFGLIAIVLAFLGFMSIFFDAGLSASLIQKKRVLDIHYNSVFYFNIVVAVILLLLTIIFATNIAKFYNNPELVLLLKVMSISFVLGALNSIQKIQLQKELNYKLLSQVTILSTIISGIIGITLAYLNSSVWSLVVQKLSYEFLMNILLWKISKWRPSLIFSLKALKGLWTFGFHIFIVSIMNAFFGRIDVLIAGKIVTPSTLGFYDRAKHLNQMVYSYSAGSLMSVLFPILSKVQSDLYRFQSIFKKVYAILTFFIFLLIGEFYINANEIILIIYSDKWIYAALYFKIIILSTFSYIYSALLTNVLISRGVSKRYLLIDILKKIIMIINIYIGFSLGLKEFLYGSVIVSLCIFLIDLYFSTKEIKLGILMFIKNTFEQIVITAISIVLVHFFISNYYSPENIFFLLLWKSILYIGSYVIFSLIFKTLGLKYLKDEILERFSR